MIPQPLSRAYIRLNTTSSIEPFLAFADDLQTMGDSLQERHNLLGRQSENLPHLRHTRIELPDFHHVAVFFCYIIKMVIQSLTPAGGN